MAIAVPAGATPSTHVASTAEIAPDQGTLSGTITTQGSGTPVAGAWVALLRAADAVLTAQAVADGGGSYSLEAEAGEYFLYLIDPTADHAAAMWGPPEVVEIVAGGVTTVDPTMDLSTGAVTGVVTDDVSGNPIAGAWAVALDVGGAPEAAVLTDASGRFTLAGLRAGVHRIAYLDPSAAHVSEFYENSPDATGSAAVVVSPGGTTTADASMARQTLGPAFLALRGTVTETDSSTVLPGVMVIALRSSDFRMAGAAVTSATGRYRVNVPIGSYRLAFLDPAGNHEMEWHADQPYHALATSTPVTAPAINDASLRPNTGTLSGLVADDVTGDPIGDAWVLAIGSTGNIRGALTGGDGTFLMTDLPVGTYRAAVIDPVGGRSLEYWDDSADYGGAQPLLVTPSSATEVIVGLSVPPPPPLMDSAVGFWDVSTGLLPSGQLPDLSGNGNDLTLHPGTNPAVGPALVTPHPVRGRNLFSPGWDDMYLDTPAPASAIGALDVSWEGDTERLLAINPAEQVNWLAHQGSTTDGTFSWAVGIDLATDHVVVAQSSDGTTVTRTTSTLPFPGGLQRGAVTVDPVSGTLRLYRQAFDAPIEAFDLPYTDPSWELVEAVEGTGPSSLFASDQPIRHSSSMSLDAVDWDLTEGWFKALYRFRIRDHASAADVAYFDIDLMDDEPVWGIETGLPPVGTQTSAKVTDIAGRGGEVWTIHNFMTTSYPMVVVDHAALVFGNGSYAEAPVDDAVFDLADGTDLSVWVVYGTPRVGGYSTHFPLVAFKNRAATDHGWRLSGPSTDDAGPRAFVADGALTMSNDSPAITEGATTISGLQVDQTPPAPGDVDDGRTDTILSYTDGQIITDRNPGSLAGLGSLSNPGARLRVATHADDGENKGSFAFIGMAIFRRTLTQPEIDRLPYEFGLVPAPPA